MTIRSATENDVKNISLTYVHNHRTTYKNLLSEEYFRTLTEELAFEKWQTYIKDCKNKVWVAEDDTGFLGFAASMPDEELSGTWYLDSLHVCESARNKGVGTALINTVGNYALCNKYEKMSICIVIGNKNADKLYRKLGAEHLKYFTGKMAKSEKLIWKNLKIFEKI